MISRKNLYALPPVKKLRERKWRRHALAFMFSHRQTEYLLGHPEKRGAAIRRQAAKFPEHARKIRLSAEKMTEDPSGIDDIIFCNFAFGFSVNEYICYGFAEKTMKERLAYISEREIFLFGYLMNDIDAMAVFSDKLLTYKKFGDYYGRGMIAAEPSSRHEFLRFVKDHPVFVAKNARESCGRSVELLHAGSGEEAEKLFDRLSAVKDTVIEEPVIQCAALASFNPSSVNTARCVTVNINGKISMPYAFLKTGRAGSFIDNGASGGIMTGIDPKTGALFSFGMDENGIKYETHPDSGKSFGGFVLPAWEDAVRLCQTLAEQIPEVRFIGWDIACTDSGWVVVEGNALSEAIGMQSVLGRGIRADIVNVLERCGIDIKKYR